MDLSLSAHSPAAQSRVLVAVAPAIHSALDEASFTTQGRVEVCESPAYRVALSLVDEAVAFVVFLAAAGAWVDAVLCLEVLAESVDVDGLDVAPDGVLHLHAVSRVLECDPLDSVAILANDERSCCGDWTRCSAGTTAAAHRRALVKLAWWHAWRGWSGNRV